MMSLCLLLFFTDCCCFSLFAFFFVGGGGEPKGKPLFLLLYWGEACAEHKEGKQWENVVVVVFL